MKKPLKIAIIGGGGAGMMCAYLLNKAGHHVSIFEKQAILGGNIRTTNKNLQIEGMDQDLFLEGGVVEFPEGFHHFRKILDELGVKQVPITLSTAYFSNAGKAWLTPEMARRNRKGLQKWIDSWQYLALQAFSLPLWLKLRKIHPSKLHGQSLEKVLKDSGVTSTWVKNLVMYSYSIPFKHIGNFPAEMGIPAMRDYMMGNWFRIEGGVYSYIEKMLDRIQGDIYCNAAIQGIQRTANGVLVQLAHEEKHFDKVVFATPPDQVLHLLSDPTPEEVHRFRNWKENYAETIIHSDLEFYKRYNIRHPSAFDFFETDKGWGYNAHLNRLCAVSGNTPYSLAYNLEGLIDPSKIVHRQPHFTPFYEVVSFAFREEIIKNNGTRNTYHAGAYLGDGLHEGAAVSAVRVADLVG